jgi:hypothetical protein
MNKKAEKHIQYVVLRLQKISDIRAQMRFLELHLPTFLFEKNQAEMAERIVGQLQNRDLLLPGIMAIIQKRFTKKKKRQRIGKLKRLRKMGDAIYGNTPYGSKGGLASVRGFDPPKPKWDSGYIPY